MAFVKILIAVCSLAAIAEGQFNAFRNFPNFPFGGFQPMYMRPQFPGRFQLPPLPQPPPLPFGFGFGFPGAFVDVNDPLNRPLVDISRRGPGRFSETIDFGGRGGSFSGMTVMSSSNGEDGVTIVSTDKNGVKETFISEGNGQFYKVPSALATPGTISFANKLMRGRPNYTRQTFMLPETRPAVKFAPLPQEIYY